MAFYLKIVLSIIFFLVKRYLISHNIKIMIFNITDNIKIIKNNPSRINIKFFDVFSKIFDEDTNNSISIPIDEI